MQDFSSDLQLAIDTAKSSTMNQTARFWIFDQNDEDAETSSV